MLAQVDLHGADLGDARPQPDRRDAAATRALCIEAHLQRRELKQLIATLQAGPNLRDAAEVLDQVKAVRAAAAPSAT